MIRTITLCALASAGLAAPALACPPPPPRSYEQNLAASATPRLYDYLSRSAFVELVRPVAWRPTELSGSWAAMMANVGLTTYTLQVDHRLKGMGEDTFEIDGAAGAVAVEPVASDGTDYAALHAQTLFWDEFPVGTPSTAFLSLPTCANSMALILEQTYLVFRTAEGGILAIEPVGANDQLVQGVRNLIAEPEARRPWETDLRDYLVRHRHLDRIEITQCDPSRYEVEITKTGEYQPGRGLVRDAEDWVEGAVARRGINYARGRVESPDCEAGEEFLVTHDRYIASFGAGRILSWDLQSVFLGAYPIEDGQADFSTTYSQIAVTDERAVPLTDVEAWFAAAPAIRPLD
ncbi:hypothetical protein [Maricaulis salignorans]|uniref:Uncharacterized protein n=1 Tax=Maricaulis salignorans TaxID=144026 RepID=A0A1G9N7F7_9PROT|nr:hypothetical protein [Maricaulis salignorans]SDL82303.1 hypothetical protein SAMN04488568_102241 [Maricaulis salignorans]